MNSPGHSDFTAIDEMQEKDCSILSQPPRRTLIASARKFPHTKLSSNTITNRRSRAYEKSHKSNAYLGKYTTNDDELTKQQTYYDDTVQSIAEECTPNSCQVC